MNVNGKCRVSHRKISNKVSAGSTFYGCNMINCYREGEHAIINKNKVTHDEDLVNMKLVQDKISNKELKVMSENMFDGLVKAVVDIEKEIMVVDAEMYADQEDFLLQQGSEQKDLWGINFYPDEVGSEDWLEFDSMINLRPSQKNRSRGVESEETRNKIIEVVEKLVEK